MKLSLISTALLAAVALCALNEEIEHVKPTTAGKVLTKILADKKDLEGNVEALRNTVEDQDALRKLLSKVTGTQARGMKLDHFKTDQIDSDLAVVLLCLSPDAIKVLGMDRTIELLKATDERITDFNNFPLDYFSNSKFVLELLRAFAVTVEEAGIADADGEPTFYTDVDAAQKFFTVMSPEQFGKVMSKCPTFHKDILTGESLNILVDEVRSKKLKDYISKVSPKFLDSINADKKRRVPLNSKVVPLLPVNFLNEIRVANSPEEGEFYTAEQLKAFKKCKDEPLDFSSVPPKKMHHLNGASLPKIAKKGLSDEQLNKLSSKQWNDLLAKKEGCKLLKEGIHLKDVSSIEFGPKCFEKISPDVQSYILTRHTSLPDDILSHVTAKMVEEWSAKGDSGLNILRHCSNKSVLAHIGESVKEKDHPLKDLSPSKLSKKLKSQMDNLTDEQLSVMKISKPKSLADLRKDAEWVSYRDDIFDLIDNFKMSSEKKYQRGSKKSSSSSSKDVDGASEKSEKCGKAWAQLTLTDLQRLTTPSYSKLAGAMTMEAFDRINIEAMPGFSPASIIELPFFKDLSADQYENFSDDAFAYVSAGHAGKFNLGQVHKDQLKHVSEKVEAGKSYFSVAKAEEMKALGSEGLTILTAVQWGPVQPAVFKEIITKELLPLIPADSTTLFTAAQVNLLGPEVLAVITPEQVRMMGSGVGSEKESARSVLEAKKDKLSSASKAALVRSGNSETTCNAGASSFAVPSAAALLALSALLL